MSDPMRNAGVTAGLSPQVAGKSRHAGAGLLTVFVATVAMPLRSKGTSWALAISGALTVLLMSATNFALHSDFRWLLLLPALVWLAGLVVYLANRGAPCVGYDRGIGGVN